MISVLYVDDDTSLLEIGKFLLEKDGFVEVDTCSSVNEALRNISGKRYDVIISDYAMPVQNGLKFLQGLRSIGVTTPFFFFAGKGRKSVIIEALNLGADFYLEKAGNAKVQFEELRQEIQRTVERRSAVTNVDQPALSEGVPGRIMGQDQSVLESVLESVAEGILAVDPTGNIVGFNQNLPALAEIPADLAGIGSDSSILLKHIRDRLEDPGDFARKTEMMSSDPGITCQGTVRLKDGQVFLWSSHARKTGDSLTGRIWSFRDISDLTRAERQLATVTGQLTAAGGELYHLREELKTRGEMIHKGEEIIRILTRATPDGIVSSIDGTIVKVNEQLADMLGYSPAELSGRPLLDVISPDSSAEVMTSLRSGSGGTYEFGALHRNGSSFRAEATAHPVRYRGDTILISVVRRVSDTAFPRENIPERGGIPVKTEGEETVTSREIPSEINVDNEIQPEPITGAGSTDEIPSKIKPDKEIQPEPVPGVPAPESIPAQEPAGKSLTWEVDEEHLTADPGDIQPSQVNDLSSLITEIEVETEPDTGTRSHGRWALISRVFKKIR